MYTVTKIVKQTKIYYKVLLVYKLNEKKLFDNFTVMEDLARENDVLV